MATEHVFRIKLPPAAFTTNNKAQVAQWVMSDKTTRMVRYFFARNTKVNISNKMIKIYDPRDDSRQILNDQIVFNFYEEDDFILPGNSGFTKQMAAAVANSTVREVDDLTPMDFESIFLPGKRFNYTLKGEYLVLSSKQKINPQKIEEEYNMLANRYDAEYSASRKKAWRELKRVQMLHWFVNFPVVFGFDLYDLPAEVTGQNILEVITDVMNQTGSPFIVLYQGRLLSPDEEVLFKKVYIGEMQKAAMNEQKDVTRQVETATKAQLYAQILTEALHEKQEKLMEAKISFFVFTHPAATETMKKTLEQLYAVITSTREFLVHKLINEELVERFALLFPNAVKEDHDIQGFVTTDGIFAAAGPFVGTNLEFGRYPFGKSFRIHPMTTNFTDAQEAGAAFFDPIEAYHDKISPNAHIIVSGASGSGKSMTVKGLIRRFSLKYGDRMHIVIADASGEYTLGNAMFMRFLEGEIYDSQAKEDSLYEGVPRHPLLINPMTIAAELWDNPSLDKLNLVRAAIDRLDQFLKIVVENLDDYQRGLVLNMAKELYFLGPPVITGYKYDEYGVRIPVISYLYWNQYIEAVQKAMPDRTPDQLVDIIYQLVDTSTSGDNGVQPIYRSPTLQDLLIVMEARGLTRSSIYTTLYKMVNGGAGAILGSESTHISLDKKLVGLYVPNNIDGVPIQVPTHVFYVTLINQMVMEWEHRYNADPSWREHHLMVVLDEFWQYLETDAYGQVKLADILDRWIRFERKFNISFILLSQNFQDDFVKKLPALYQNSAIKLIGKQEKSSEDAMAAVTGTGVGGLPINVLEMMTQLTPGHFFINTPQGTSLTYVSLSPLEMALYDTSGAYVLEDVMTIEDVRKGGQSYEEVF